MTKIILAALLGLLAAAPRPAQAAPNEPATYVSTIRVTPGASPTHVLAFQNTSADIDVLVRRIEIVNATTMTVTGGQAQYWVYGSTQLSHTTAAGSFYSYGTTLASQPSYLTISTGPYNVLLEGDSVILTAAQRATLSPGVNPLIRPLVVDSDDAATVNRADSWGSEDLNATGFPARPLLLPRGSSRAIVIEKRQGAASDFTAGSVLLRIFYSVR